MRNDIIKIISNVKDVTNVIILTHNIDFNFLQNVVVPALARCGHPTLTIFADAACAAETYNTQRKLISGLGTRFRVVPVVMKPGFRFHPKAVLLSGPEEATLFVGSGNLTFGGWRDNAEIWAKFSTDNNGCDPFNSFQKYLDTVLNYVALPDLVEVEIDDAFNPETKNWIQKPQGSVLVLFGCPGKQSLLEQMMEVVGSNPEKLVICSPYFDPLGKALQKLIAASSPTKIDVLCQPEYSTLTQEAWEPIKNKARLVWTTCEHLSAEGEPRKTFIHAKFYGFVNGDEVTLFIGSANCSQAALTIPGKGNAELIAVQRLSKNEFQKDIIGELKQIKEEVNLASLSEESSDRDGSSELNLRVLAARCSYSGELQIAYAPAQAIINECIIGKNNVDFSIEEPGVLCIHGQFLPDDDRNVVLVGTIAALYIESNPAWIDYETELRMTARGRSLAYHISTKIKPGVWDVGAWTEILEVFYKNLNYTPTDTVRRGNTQSRTSSNALQFTASDVFSDDYSHVNLASMLPGFDTSHGQVRSLQKLLLRWFGVSRKNEDKEQEEQNYEILDDSEGLVDLPSKIPTRPVTKATTVGISERHKRKIKKLLSQVESTMSSGEDFLNKRKPEQLAADLKLASVLLRTGLREKWIEDELFFKTTQSIWSALFFSYAPGKTSGWLENRKEQTNNSFIEAMCSPELSAALIGWVLAMPVNTDTFNASRFMLSSALAVARFPLLWFGGEESDILRELGLLLIHTQEKFDSTEVKKAWLDLLRRGQALRHLELALENWKVPTLRQKIKKANLERAELLWQGSAGYCIVVNPVLRNKKQKAKVFFLQKGEEKYLRADFAVPISALLDYSILPRTETFGDKPRAELQKFIVLLQDGFSNESPC